MSAALDLNACLWTWKLSLSGTNPGTEPMALAPGGAGSAVSSAFALNSHPDGQSYQGSPLSRVSLSIPRANLKVNFLQSNWLIFRRTRIARRPALFGGVR